MSNLITVVLLLLLSLFPETELRQNKENRLREKINKSEKFALPNIDYQTPNRTKEFKNHKAISEAIYLVDFDSGKVLYEKNCEQRLKIASISKLMTAIVVVLKTDPHEIVTINNDGVQPGDSLMGLVNGDKISVKELLHGLLLNSGSDAALNLARHVSEDEESFVELMNNKANILGLKSTHFTNPVGWDEEKNTSTAKDATILARIALENKTIREIVLKESHISKSELNRTYHLRNTNQLLKTPYFVGVKTGTTPLAGSSLVFFYNDDERRIIGTILDSNSRFQEARILIEWTKDNFLW